MSDLQKCITGETFLHSGIIGFSVEKNSRTWSVYVNGYLTNLHTWNNSRQVHMTSELMGALHLHVSHKRKVSLFVPTLQCSLTSLISFSKHNLIPVNNLMGVLLGTTDKHVLCNMFLNTWINIRRKHLTQAKSLNKKEQSFSHLLGLSVKNAEELDYWFFFQQIIYWNFSNAKNKKVGNQSGVNNIMVGNFSPDQKLLLRRSKHFTIPDLLSIFSLPLCTHVKCAISVQHPNFE